MLFAIFVGYKLGRKCYFNWENTFKKRQFPKHFPTLPSKTHKYTLRNIEKY